MAREVKQQELVLQQIEWLQLLHTLYQANLKAVTNFLNEWFAVDMVLNTDGAEQLLLLRSKQGRHIKRKLLF